MSDSPRLVRITEPDAPGFAPLCEDLASRCAGDDWPGQSLESCARAGVFEWFVPAAWGGQEWSEADLLAGYLRLAQACLTTTFVITQRSGACRRLATSDNPIPRETWLPALAAGEIFATVAISHLTTSGRHLARPVLTARESGGDFLLDGFSPWVTGGIHADLLTVGATLDDGRQLLLAVPTELDGISAREPEQLSALNGSRTGAVDFENVRVPRRWLLAGPIENVMKQGGANTGGLNTSTLALGLATAAVDYLRQQSIRRPDLAPPADALQRECDALHHGLLQAASGGDPSLEELRSRANSLVLRATQAALAAAKGAGFLARHPASRWCHEALFFLVWSCPQEVLSANLREWAGLQR